MSTATELPTVCLSLSALLSGCERAGLNNCRVCPESRSRMDIWRGPNDDHADNQRLAAERLEDRTRGENRYNQPVWPPA